MEEDWDLYAVVRGCAAVSTTSSAVHADTGADSLVPCRTRIDSHPFISFQPPAIHDLYELYKPLFSKPQTQHKKQLHLSSATQNQTPKPKRRKNQFKKVCEIPEEGLAADIWAWRKYGQKPIKGSPYPRGYYRCSTSKGCLARKQVERSKMDPGTFIVAYTGEHNHPAPAHRSSLAGTSRRKADSGDSPASSPELEKERVEDELGGGEDDDGKVDDDFFMGLDELLSPEHLPASFALPWLANSPAPFEL